METDRPQYDSKGYVLVLDMGDGRKAWMCPIVLKEMGLENARVEALRALTRNKLPTTLSFSIKGSLHGNND